MASSNLVAPELASIKVQGVTREAFLIRATLAAGATYGALSATPYITRALAAGEVSDVDILNYALTLEYLETEFYTLGVKQVKGLSGDEKKLAQEIRDNEAEHVDALAATVKKLGGKPVAKPTFDFGGAFGDRATFLKTANVLEDAGVSAYNGAGPLIKSVDVLGAAGSIVQVEARHASLIRLARNKPPAPLAFDKSATMDAILKKVTPFIVS
jgi:rubrerythrin